MEPRKKRPAAQAQGSRSCKTYGTYKTYMSYQELQSYQQAIIIQDFTVEFLKRYILRTSRTFDQMTQAARSGKQNIVEGTAVSKTSPRSELMLLGVARGSLEELLEDYRDFLRQRGFGMWSKDDSRVLEIRALVYKTDKTDRADRTDKTHKTYTTYASYAPYLDNPEKAANAMIVLINQTNFLLDQQLRSVRAQMEEKGVGEFSHTQKLSRVLAERRKKDEKFDAYLRGIVERGKNKTDKTP